MTDDDYAYLGRKPCGCPTYARLCSAPKTRWPSDVKVKKVHVDRASVAICRCGETA